MILAKTPLAERIERWAKSGKASKIALHPKDYWTLERANLIDKVSEQYGLAVTCLGGEEGLKKQIAKEQKKAKLRLDRRLRQRKLNLSGKRTVPKLRLV